MAPHSHAFGSAAEDTDEAALEEWWTRPGVDVANAKARALAASASVGGLAPQELKKQLSSQNGMEVDAAIPIMCRALDSMDGIAGTFAPGQGPAAFMHRLLRDGNGGCDACVLLVALLYLERLEAARGGPVLTAGNWRALLLVACLSASKYFEQSLTRDDLASQWAKMGGTSLEKLNALEVGFLFSLEFKRSVAPEEFRALLTRIVYGGGGLRVTASASGQPAMRQSAASTLPAGLSWTAHVRRSPSTPARTSHCQSFDSIFSPVPGSVDGPSVSGRMDSRGMLSRATTPRQKLSSPLSDLVAQGVSSLRPPTKASAGAGTASPQMLERDRAAGVPVLNGQDEFWQQLGTLAARKWSAEI